MVLTELKMIDFISYLRLVQTEQNVAVSTHKNWQTVVILCFKNIDYKSLEIAIYILVSL